jgi:hypothetical protein
MTANRKAVWDSELPLLAYYVEKLLGGILLESAKSLESL